MRFFWVILAMTVLVLTGAVSAAAPVLAQNDFHARITCITDECGNTAHGEMTMAACAVDCLKSGIEAVGSVVFSFAGQFSVVLLAMILAAALINTARRTFRIRFKERSDFAKLFLEQSLHGVILLN